MTGHHGQPPQIGVSLPLDKPFELCDQEAALAFVTDVSELLLGNSPIFPKVDLCEDTLLLLVAGGLRCTV